MADVKNDTSPSLECCLRSSSGLSGTEKNFVYVKKPGANLQISFRRTIRVPDGTSMSELPPDMGAFPLYSVAQYKDKLPQTMALKGGLFFPMYRKSSASTLDDL